MTSRQWCWLLTRLRLWNRSNGWAYWSLYKNITSKVPPNYTYSKTTLLIPLVVASYYRTPANLDGIVIFTILSSFPIPALPLKYIDFHFLLLHSIANDASAAFRMSARAGRTFAKGKMDIGAGCTSAICGVDIVAWIAFARGRMRFDTVWACAESLKIIENRRKSRENGEVRTQTFG